MLRYVLAVCLLVAWGCDAEDPCGEDEMHMQGVCVPKPADSGVPPKDAGRTPDAAAETDDAGSDSCTEDQASILGDECTESSDCNCAAPYCAKQPSEPKGSCTVYCPDPADCPDGYRCFDLSGVGVSGVEPFCVPM